MQIAAEGKDRDCGSKCGPNEIFHRENQSAARLLR
jgi:hypothetical protein